MFAVHSKRAQPKAMEPISPAAFRGPVPIPPQRANRNTNVVNSGVNPAKTASALLPNFNNSMSSNHSFTGTLWILFGKPHCTVLISTARLWLNCLMFFCFFSLSAFQPSSSKDSAQTLASDFGFEDNFNHTLKVEEKKNHQNRIVASREPPPVPPLPPRKASYISSNPQAPPPPIPKERVVSLPANSFTSSSKPE